MKIKEIFNSARQEMIIKDLTKSVKLLLEDLDTAKSNYEQMEDLYHHYKEMTISLARENRKLKTELKRVKKDEAKHK